jgi:hypothetical protein
MMRTKWAATGLAAALLWAQSAAAQDIVIPNIIELSGGGATVGAMWKNGSSMAVDEIMVSVRPEDRGDFESRNRPERLPDLAGRRG